MTNFKIYAISDLHSNQGRFEYAAKIITKEKPDLVIICGDISHSSKPDKLNHMISILNFKPIYFVMGNMDGQKINIRISNAYNIHLRYKQFKDYFFYGLGGPNNILDNIINFARPTISKIDPNRLILVTHVPPKNHCDKVYSGSHIGSKKLEKLVSEIQPKLVLCGHVHEDRGISTLKNTMIVNVGPAGYIISIDENHQISYKMIS
ncbi:MAG: metallophosphoesterase family protein [Candidatus Helarchaeota archaeon]